VAQIRKHLWLIPQAPTAAHIMWAYKLAGTDDQEETKTAYDCNGEFGAQGPLVAALRTNTLVAVLRWGGPKLGPKRFDIIRDAAAEVVQAICE
jgi:hypothetical protein